MGGDGGLSPDRELPEAPCEGIDLKLPRLGVRAECHSKGGTLAEHLQSTVDDICIGAAKGQATHSQHLLQGKE